MYQNQQDRRSERRIEFPERRFYINYSGFIVCTVFAVTYRYQRTWLSCEGNVSGSISQFWSERLAVVVMMILTSSVLCFLVVSSDSITCLCLLTLIAEDAAFAFAISIRG